MQILTNDENEIISFALVGGFENGIEINDLPEGFIENFSPKYYVYTNNRIEINKNYEEDNTSVEITTPIQTEGTDTELRKMFANMQIQLVQANMMVMQLSQQNARLSQEMVTINQKISGGNE